MGFIQFQDSDGTFKDLGELSFADTLELELALNTPNTLIQKACFVCQAILPNDSKSYFCENHFDTRK